MIDIQTTERPPFWLNNSTSSSSVSSMEISDENSIPPELLHSLRQHSLFQRTNNEHFLEEIACHMHLRIYSPRDVIIVEGEPSKAMFFLLKGSVDVCSADFERIYATLPKGSCFGEIGILFSMPRTATVIASSKCIVALLTADDVNTILPQYPEVQKVLLFEAEERLALLNKSKSMNGAERISHKPLTERNVEEFTGARNLLQKSPYFKDCPEEFLHHISLRVEPRHYAPNDLIYKRGDEGTDLYFILSGTVELVNLNDTRSDIPVERLSSGDYFGDISVLLNKARAADARAVTAIELYILRKSDFIKAVSSFPNLQQHFKEMAEKSLSQLKTKAPLLFDTETGKTDSLMLDQTSKIKPSSVCSTTSDQDPTLLPQTAASAFRGNETRKRRASVAVWSDPYLVALANRNLKQTNSEQQANLKENSVSTKTSKSVDFYGDGRLTLFNEEILGLVVEHLDFLSVLRFAAVSKRCRDFVKYSDKVFQKVDLSHLNKRITDEVIESIVSLIDGRTKQISLSQCFYITDVGFKQLVESVPLLEAMDLNSCWLLTDKSMATLALSCPRLTQLDLSNCRKISDAGIFQLLDGKASRGQPQLTNLSLSYCKKLSDMTMSHLATFCSQSLVSLNIQRCTRITDQGFGKWAETRFPSLSTLNLTDCSFLTDQAVAYLVTAAPHLRSLSLSFCCALSDSAIEGLITLSELQDLDASFCGAAVSDVSIRSLLKSNVLEQIRCLNLRGCVRITDMCIKSILELAKLNTLNISQCPGISLNAKQNIKASGSIINLVA
ncbi:F-box/LRR-repeat protein 2 [Choanephora cucurbitarum]|uniref:F-box/LRR-repeat protein 2 n=1 Tax=Choanephora cucurbitarum TaxID=101091 RepID=A0A1C7NIT8_9FUNG|nr:F-box/LRR-repeat protein 2 [Choanephora cucurbitarum]